MKTVFICHPFQNKEENIELTKSYCTKAILEGNCPFSPALHYPLFLDESTPEGREKGMDCGLEVLKWCDELWICGDVITDGMHLEINFAENPEYEILIRHVRLEK